MNEQLLNVLDAAGSEKFTDSIKVDQTHKFFLLCCSTVVLVVVPIRRCNSQEFADRGLSYVENGLVTTDLLEFARFMIYGNPNGHEKVQKDRSGQIIGESLQFLNEVSKELKANTTTDDLEEPFWRP